jgi:Ca-activated chloride channel family protein
MTRILAFGTLAACVLAVLPAPAQDQPSFRGSSDVVRVFATVTDRDGRLVTTLAREQFEVRDQGKPQPITQFDNSPQPIRLIVMLDVSGSMEGNLPLLRGASEQLFARLRPEDVARVGSFGHEVTISSEFTKDTKALLAALPHSIAPDAPTPLWRGLDKALDSFGEAGDTRRVILVLSDGKDSGMFSFKERPISQAEIIERARREDVMIYAVGMRSRTRQAPPVGLGPGGLQAALTADWPDPGLARVAEETGGGYVEIRFNENLAAAFTGVADELHTQYLLGFVPAKRDGKVHEINVRVSAGGMKPRGRKSYLAPKS